MLHGTAHTPTVHTAAAHAPTSDHTIAHCYVFAPPSRTALAPTAYPTIAHIIAHAPSAHNTSVHHAHVHAHTPTGSSPPDLHPTMLPLSLLCVRCEWLLLCVWRVLSMLQERCMRLNHAILWQLHHTALFPALLLLPLLLLLLYIR